jgi:hypothetical protein
MNNTKTLTAIAAILIAATLVVVAIFAATVTHSASAYYPKKGEKKDDGGNDNGNTVTTQINKNKGSASGFGTINDNEAQNIICTHPSEICDQSTPSVAAQEQTALEISGQGTGGGLRQNIFCPDVSHSGGLNVGKSIEVHIKLAVQMSCFYTTIFLDQ